MTAGQNQQDNSARKTPRVTVVMATYNRPDVLKLAIASVLWQSIDDWELIVVGDKFTDHTPDTVAAFGDERIRFINLDENCGNQAGPNNRGMAEAKAEVIAIVNHDDIIFPDHLEKTLAAIDAGAEMVWGRWLLVAPEGMQDELSYVAPDGSYVPQQDVIPSAWVHTKALFEKVGPWPDASECHANPDQHWIFDVFKSGATMRALKEVTLAHIPANMRQNIYETNELSAQEQLLEAVRSDPDWVAKHVAAMPGDAIADPGELKWISRVGMWFGHHPHAWHYIIRFRSKGRRMKRWRSKLGLPAK